MFINKVLPGVRINSFEPIKDCYKKLFSKKKEIKKFSPFNYAIGDVNSEKDFYENDFSYSSSFLRIPDNSVINFPFTKNQTFDKVQIKGIDDKADSSNKCNNLN